MVIIEHSAETLTAMERAVTNADFISRVDEFGFQASHWARTAYAITMSDLPSLEWFQVKPSGNPG